MISWKGPGTCDHGRRCQPCLQRQIEIQLRLRRELTMPEGKLLRVGQMLGGTEAWQGTIDDKIAQLLVELVTGVPADGIAWAMIGRSSP